MIHNMHLLNSIYDSVLKGSKDVEIRLLDKKRSKIKVGDKINFINHFDESKSFNVLVTKLKVFNDIGDCMNSYALKRIYKEDATYEELIDTFNSIYSLEEQEDNKVLAIEFKLI